MSDTWSPAVYGQFGDERSRPFYDLAALVRGPVGRVVDLGCGPGKLTAELPRLVGATEVLGIDNSPAMLAAAAAYAGPHLRFEAGDLGEFSESGTCDLVFSNAALHWSPGHRALFGRLATALRPGGQLAVQMPRNAHHRAARLADELAYQEPFCSALGGAPPPDVVAVHVLTPADYALILRQLGFAEQRVFLEVYLHELESTAAVADWLRGTTLTRFSARMPPELFDLYLAELRGRLLEELGDQRPFPFTFERLFLWACLQQG